jgi:hypothetical protein
LPVTFQDSERRGSEGDPIELGQQRLEREHLAGK